MGSSRGIKAWQRFPPCLERTIMIGPAQSRPNAVFFGILGSIPVWNAAYRGILTLEGKAPNILQMNKAQIRELPTY